MKYTTRFKIYDDDDYKSSKNIKNRQKNRRISKKARRNQDKRTAFDAWARA